VYYKKRCPLTIAALEQTLNEFSRQKWPQAQVGWAMSCTWEGALLADYLGRLATCNATLSCAQVSLFTPMKNRSGTLSLSNGLPAGVGGGTVSGLAGLSNQQLRAQKVGLREGLLFLLLLLWRDVVHVLPRAFASGWQSSPETVSHGRLLKLQDDRVLPHHSIIHLSCPPPPSSRDFAVTGAGVYYA
jgi:hypothetical protein